MGEDLIFFSKEILNIWPKLNSISAFVSLLCMRSKPVGSVYLSPLVLLKHLLSTAVILKELSALTVINTDLTVAGEC